MGILTWHGAIGRHGKVLSDVAYTVRSSVTRQHLFPWSLATVTTMGQGVAAAMEELETLATVTTLGQGVAAAMEELEAPE